MALGNKISTYPDTKGNFEPPKNAKTRVFKPLDSKSDKEIATQNKFLEIMEDKLDNIDFLDWNFTNSVDESKFILSIIKKYGINLNDYNLNHVTSYILSIYKKKSKGEGLLNDNGVDKKELEKIHGEISSSFNDEFFPKKKTNIGDFINNKKGKEYIYQILKSSFKDIIEGTIDEYLDSISSIVSIQISDLILLKGYGTKGEKDINFDNMVNHIVQLLRFNIEVNKNPIPAYFGLGSDKSDYHHGKFVDEVKSYLGNKNIIF